MNAKQIKTLIAIFEEPVRSNINWGDIERLFEALGGEVSGGKGSRRRVFLNGRKAVFDGPHPESDTDKWAVKSLRRFLLEAGVDKP